MSSNPPQSRPRPAFDDDRRLYNVVAVRFRTNFLKHDCDARDLQLSPDDQVVVRTDRGPAIAEVCGPVYRDLREPKSLARVLRRASPEDIQRADRNEALEDRAQRFCLERIRARNLRMKLVRCQYMQDGTRIVFYFTADGRVDFRDLVKDLAHRFRTRIEMHQIGAREGTRMIGGVGPCGRELCCSTFLENFSPVSTRMAREQGLTLNPTRVSGMCGRLMCCLVYEQMVYKNMRRALPRAGQKVLTERGPAEVVRLDVIERRVVVRLADDNIETFGVDQIDLSGAASLKETVDVPPDQRAAPSKRSSAPVHFVEIAQRRFSRRRRRRRSDD